VIGYVTSRWFAAAAVVLVALTIPNVGCSGGTSGSSGNVGQLAISACLADFQADGWRDVGGGVLERSEGDYVSQVRDFAAERLLNLKGILTAADRANGIEEEWSVDVHHVGRYRKGGGGWTQWGDGSYTFHLRRLHSEWERSDAALIHWVSASEALRGECGEQGVPP
jgi:hypothetical protein